MHETLSKCAFFQGARDRHRYTTVFSFFAAKEALQRLPAEFKSEPITTAIADLDIKIGMWCAWHGQTPEQVNATYQRYLINQYDSIRLDHEIEFKF